MDVWPDLFSLVILQSTVQIYELDLINEIKLIFVNLQPHFFIRQGNPYHNFCSTTFPTGEDQPAFS